MAGVIDRRIAAGCGGALVDPVCEGPDDGVPCHQVADDVGRVVGRTVVDNDDLVVRFQVAIENGRHRIRQPGGAVVGGDDVADGSVHG
jgi:hypothetical protein